MENKKQSWSTALFLKINAGVGKRPLLDRIMIFAADNLVYILILCSFLWATTMLEAENSALLHVYIQLLITALVFGIGLSWIIGWILPNPRPIKTLPKIHQLLQPMSTWKSFPSDHTIGSFTFATIPLLLGAPTLFVLFLYSIAIIIAVARVYVGVHYPRDILGGIVIAFLFSFLAPTILPYITTPLYDAIKFLVL